MTEEPSRYDQLPVVDIAHNLPGWLRAQRLPNGNLALFAESRKGDIWSVEFDKPDPGNDIRHGIRNLASMKLGDEYPATDGLPNADVRAMQYKMLALSGLSLDKNQSELLARYDELMGVWA